MKTLLLTTLFLLILRSTAQIITGPFPAGSTKTTQFDKVSGTVIFSSINLGMNAINIACLTGKKEKSNAGFGIITGAIQLTYGTFNHKEKDLQAVDISFGFATVIFSMVCLLKKDKKPKEQKLSLALSSPQTPFNNKISGASLLLKF